MQSSHGVVVAADLTQEWLLPWWWEHYKLHNRYPVTFVDFGMSAEMKAWCSARGQLLFLSAHEIFIARKEEITPLISKEMEAICGAGIWQSRSAWFKKPLACLQSPYETSVWIDLDCEVRGSIAELFHLKGDPLALARDFEPIAERRNYNTGVIVFKKGARALKRWADLCLTRNHECAGDQDVFTEMIYEEKIDVEELSLLYNWSRRQEENPNAIIIHWHGRHGKTVIEHKIMRSNLEKTFF